MAALGDPEANVIHGFTITIFLARLGDMLEQVFRVDRFNQVRHHSEMHRCNGRFHRGHAGGQNYERTGFEFARVSDEIQMLIAGHIDIRELAVRNPFWQVTLWLPTVTGDIAICSRGFSGTFGWPTETPHHRPRSKSVLLNSCSGSHC